VPAPLVSIGLPVFNEEAHLARTLDSLRAQDHAEIEIVISDNASTDRTAEICREAAGRDRRLTYHRQAANAGSRRNFEAVFEHSSGPFFLWAGAHDLWDRRFVSSSLAALGDSPGAVLAQTRTVYVDDGGAASPIESTPLDLRGMSPAERLRTLLRRLGRCDAFHGLMRSEAVRRALPLDLCIAPDHLLLMRMSLLGDWVVVPEPLFFRRVVRGRERHLPRLRRTLRVVAGPEARLGRLPLPWWDFYLRQRTIIRRSGLPAAERRSLTLEWLRYGGRHWRRLLGDLRYPLRRMKAEGQ
jgi:glycosyltransferase involved in cell wall biosynthesis